MRDQIIRMLEPLKRRIVMMLARGVIKQIYDDSGIQLVRTEVLEGEVRDKVERFQDYGMTSNPPDDSEAIMCFVGGNRNHGLILRIDNREFRLKNLEKGEVALYTDEGDYIHFKRNNELHMKSNKYKFEGASDELLDLLDQFLTEEINLADKLSTDTTNTLIGPMQLNGFAYYAARKASLTTIQTKLEALKV